MKMGRRKRGGREDDEELYFYVLTNSLNFFSQTQTRSSTHLVPLPLDERNDSSGNSATEATQHQYQQQNLQACGYCLGFPHSKIR